MRRAGRAALVVLAIAAGCKDEPNAIAFDSDPAPLPGPRCMPTVDGADVALRVALVAGAGVSAEEAIAALEPARRYFVDHGIELVPEGIDHIDDRYLLGGTAAGLERALAGAGVEPGSSRARAIVAREVAGPLVALLATRASAAGVIDVVVVERIASPRSPVQMLVSDLAGLTLSPLLEPERHGSIELAGVLDVAEHAPTVLLSTRELGRLPPRLRRTVAAHEMGHALGLAHRRDRENVMSPIRETACLPGLGPDQLGQIGRGAAELSRRDRR